MLSLTLAGAILPFVIYFDPKFNEDKEFIQFKEFATTNVNIFYDFARYMSKNYIFYVDKSNPHFKKEDKNTSTYYSSDELKDLLKDNFNNIFDPRVIRRRFLEFVNKHMARALSFAQLDKNAKRVSSKYTDHDLSQSYIMHHNDDENRPSIQNPLKNNKSSKVQPQTKIGTSKISAISKKEDIYATTNSKFSNPFMSK